MFFHLWFEVYAKRLLNDKYMYYHTLHSRLMLDPETGGSQALRTLFFMGLLLSDFQSTKASSFQNRSSLNFAYRLKTLFSTIVPCRIFKFSPN